MSGRSRANFKSLTAVPNTRFGKWTVIGPADNAGTHRAAMCRCDCGREGRVALSNLHRGVSTMCRSCVSNRAVFKRKTHGATSGRQETPEYRVWKNMKQRCLNPKSTHYHRYGGRGIKICQKWMTFEAFFRDMGQRPSPKHTIERMDNDGNYEPDNCCWATKKVQSRNTSRNVHVRINGKEMTVADAVEAAGGVVQSNFYQRTAERIRSGWDAERALTQPPRRS